MWERFHDAAIAAGAEVVLSHPYKTRLIADASLKSDKVDSQALAALLRLQALPTAFVPDEKTRGLRRVVRDRRCYRKQQRAVMSRTYAFLLSKGVPYDPGILTLKRRREELRSWGHPEVQRGLDRLRGLDGTTLGLDRAIRGAFDGSSEARLLESIPGVGRLTAVTLVAFLCPISRFATFDELSSYCGLCPTNHQSADTSYQGRLKSDCNTMLRSALVGAAWVHRQQARQSYVSRVGRRIARRKGAQRGSIAAAHALLRVVYAILKRETPYSPDAPERPSCKIRTAASPP